MTIREAISSVKTGVKQITPDSILWNKFVYSQLQANAKTFIQRESDLLKLAKIQNLYQPLKCVDMAEAPAIDPCCGVSSRCKVWRTCKPLPEFYTDTFGNIVRSVTTIDGNSEITITTPKGVLRRLLDKNTKYDKSVYGFFSEDHFYLVDERYRKIQIEGLFTEDISHLNECENQSECKPFLDRNWYVPAKLEGQIIDFTIQRIANTYSRIPKDENINKSEI